MSDLVSSADVDGYAPILPFANPFLEACHELAGMADKLLDKCSKARTQQEQRMYANKAEGIVTSVRYLGDRYGIDVSDMLKNFDVEVKI